MIQTDESALICDLAETYGIFDYRALPLRTVAALACGLREDSRIRMAVTGQKISAEIALMATVADRLGLLVWMQTKDGQKNRNRPESILERLTRKEKQKDDLETFPTPAEYEAARMKILNGA